MTSLIISLPVEPSRADTQYTYSVVSEAKGVTHSGRSSPGEFPVKSGLDVVAVMPLGALSWHQITLPTGLREPQLRAALHALLEDQLLDDASNVYLALASGSGSTRWVAACQLSWLRGHVRHLEQEQCVVTRIVPELEPGSEGAVSLYVLSSPTGDQIACSDPQRGVVVLPLCAGSLDWLKLAGDKPLFVEPELAGRVQKLLARPVNNLAAPERAVVAACSGSNLAQFEFRRSAHTRAIRAVRQGWLSFFFGDAWRSVRWILLLLVSAQLVVLNVRAWREKTQIEEKKLLMRSILRETFPNLTLVIDPPLQMQRELAALRQRAGAIGPQDFEALLEVFKLGPTLQDIEYETAQLRLRGIRPTSAEIEVIGERLNSYGYQLRQDGEAWVVIPLGKK